MSKQVERWLGAAFGFGAGIVWVAAGAGAALLCVLGAALCAGIVTAREADVAGWLGATATGLRKQVAARVPAQRPARTLTRPSPRPKAPKATKATKTAEPQAPAPAPKPYDHDEPSSEHVYEVATYGW